MRPFLCTRAHQLASYSEIPITASLLLNSLLLSLVLCCTLLHRPLRLLQTESLCPSQIRRLKSYPKCDGIRKRDLWEVTRVVPSWVGLVSTLRRISRELASSALLFLIRVCNWKKDFTLLAPWCWTSSLQKIHFCYLYTT